MGSSVNRRGSDLVQCRGEQSGNDASREPKQKGGKSHGHAVDVAWMASPACPSSVHLSRSFHG